MIKLDIFEEARGVLKGLDDAEMGTVGIIGGVEILFPQELRHILLKYVGRRIGVLRTENDYRIRPIGEVRRSGGGDDGDIEIIQV